jgi:hypothetical protein
MRVSTGSKPNADQKLDEFRRKIVMFYKSAGRRSGAVVPVSTFARGSHGEFNENTHALYAKHEMASAKGCGKEMTLYTTAIYCWCQFWCHPWCQKEKGQGLNTSDLRF